VGRLAGAAKSKQFSISWVERNFCTVFAGHRYAKPLFTNPKNRYFAG